MTIRNALPFEFPYRWPDLRRFVAGLRPGEDEADEAVDYLDQRDRDLEDFLAGLGSGTAKLPFYVAASNASDESKALSNYVCDGTNDEVEIQAAVDAMFALQATSAGPQYPSGCVWLSEGTFNLNDVVDLDGTTGTPGVNQKSKIRGMGHVNTKLFRTNAFTRKCFTVSGGGQWSVEDLAFFDFSTALDLNDTAEGSAVVRCWFEDCGTGVNFFGQTNGSVVDCWFFDPTTAITAYYCNRLRVSGNHFHSSSSADVYAYELTTSKIADNVSYESALFCMIEGYVRDLSIEGNVVTQQAGAGTAGGIDIFGEYDDGATVIEGVSITDNVLSCHAQALLIDGPHVATDTPPVLISDNQIVGSAQVDVRCMVTGNFVSNGIQFNDPCDKGLCANNWLGDTGVHGSAAATLTDNTTGTIVSTGAGNYLDGTWTP